MHLELRIYFHLLEMSVSDKSKINDCFIEDGFALMVGIAQPKRNESGLDCIEVNT